MPRHFNNRITCKVQVARFPHTCVRQSNSLFSVMLSSEDFWGCKLDSVNRKCQWTYDEDDTVEHKLIISQACLGADAKEGERNIVNVTIEDNVNSASNQSHAILSLRVGILEQCSISIGFTSSVTFELVSGSGPVFLVGSHLLAIDDEDDEHPYDEEDSDMAHQELSDSDEDDVSDDVDEDGVEDLGSVDGPIKRSKQNNSFNTKKPKVVGGILKKSADIDEDSDEDDYGSDDDVSGNKKSDKKVTFSNKLDIKTIPSKSGHDAEKDVEKIKAAIMKMKNKPKTLEKFTNFVKSTHKVNDPAVIAEIWKSVCGK